MTNLANVVKEKLGLSFENFVEEVRNKDSFEKLVEKMGNTEKT